MPNHERLPLKMTDSTTSGGEKGQRRSRTGFTTRRRLRRRLLIAAAWTSVTLILLFAGIAWLGLRASIINSELEAAARIVPLLKQNITENQPQEASSRLAQLQSHTTTAREAAEDPLWTLASATPFLGANFAAVTEVAQSADDVSRLGIAPLVKLFDSLNWEHLIPSGKESNLAALQDASSSLTSAAHAIRVSAERLERIDASPLLPQVGGALTQSREQLRSVTDVLDASADASQIIPGMLGADVPRQYLLIIQNNAESRASGGIPGALAVLSIDNGKLILGAQSSAADVGITSPIVPVDPEQQQIYSGRIGKYMQDVNLTPDFPTAALTAQKMWEKKTGQHVDGVVSIDPVALGYILDATGPIKINSRELVALASNGLPAELTGKNVVQTLLSDVYAKIEQPKLQDAYFAGVAKEIFAVLSDGKGSPKGVVEGIIRGTNEGRVQVWSGDTAEQSIIGKYPLSGSVTGPSVSPAQFGVYFNDGTGAKMDYYVKRTVQLVKECTKDGYQQTTVRITSTNNAPADAATSLPAYVTGAGAFGVPPGSVQTNIVVYGPVQANIETATVDGQRSDFAAHRHGNRPVGVMSVRLAPGESTTLEFTFGKIVQHTEPNVVVTPTIQDVKDVTLPTENLKCALGS